VRELAEPHPKDLHLPGPQDEDVPWVDVAMNDPILMRIVEPLAELDHQGEPVLEADWPSLRDQFRKRLAIKRLHDDHELAFVLGDVENSGEVRVIEADPDPCLARG